MQGLSFQMYSSMAAQIFMDALGSDLWEETRQSDLMLLSPVLLEGATESFIICVQKAYSRVKIQEMRCNHPAVWCFSI